jgi:hypothetical protein
MVRASVFLGVLTATLQGCGDSSPPSGHGSHLKVDVDASSTPPADLAEDASSDSPFAPLDAKYGSLPDGYAPLAVCAQCVCSAGTFCYGGSASTSFSGTCDQTASTALDVGCHAIPAGCAAEPDCVCLLQALSAQMPCYAACANNAATGGFVVYCPP